VWDTRAKEPGIRDAGKKERRPCNFRLKISKRGRVSITAKKKVKRRFSP